MTTMMKQLIAATGLCALALVATPAAAQTSNVRTAREAGSRATEGPASRPAQSQRLSGPARPCRAGGHDVLDDVKGETRAQERRRRPRPGSSGTGGYYAGGAPSREARPARVQSQNNIKRVGIATHH